MHQTCLSDALCLRRSSSWNFNQVLTKAENLLNPATKTYVKHRLLLLEHASTQVQPTLALLAGKRLRHEFVASDPPRLRGRQNEVTINNI